MSVQFNRPIPGQSLTSTPKGAPYERPPEITDPEEALQLHLAKLTDAKRMSAALDLLETGIDLQTVVEGYLRNAVMEGLHSIDVSMLIAPVIHEYIKLTAEQVGVEYEEGFDGKVDKEARIYSVASQKARRKLESMDMMPDQEKESEIPMEEDTQVEDNIEDMPKSKGLMSKENM